jgi:2'-hydroxyisoflavone reductase
MKILILGGTGFIGPHQVRYAQYRGHEVTLFNRGRTSSDMFPELETLIGDRDGQLDALRGREWDACIDNSGYVPRHVRDSAELLEGKVGRYLFTSTGSVYDFDQDELTENSTLLTLDDPTSEDVNRYYGPLKVLCEQAVEKVYGHQSTVLRLHVVAGPGDPTDRFTRWPVRIDQGGEVLAPGDRDNPVQFIDVRDLAEFMTHCLEWDVGGIYNTAGPTVHPTGMAQFLYGIRAITNNPVSFTWADDAFLREREYRVPLWWSQNSPIRAIGRVRAHKAVAAGLTFRPLAVTALDTLDWYNTLDDERKARFHPGFEQEAETLAAWKARG